MSLILEKLKFGGKVQRIAEETLCASLGEDKERTIIESLWVKYVEAGKPADLRRWIHAELEKLFLCVNERPVWFGPTPQWAFMHGKPMVFIKQLQIEKTEVSSSELPVGHCLYIFGIRSKTEHGLVTAYRVVVDDPGTKNLRIVPRQ